MQTRSTDCINAFSATEKCTCWIFRRCAICARLHPLLPGIGLSILGRQTSLGDSRAWWDKFKLFPGVFRGHFPLGYGAIVLVLVGLEQEPTQGVVRQLQACDEVPALDPRE